MKPHMSIYFLIWKQKRQIRNGGFRGGWGRSAGQGRARPGVIQRRSTKTTYGKNPRPFTSKIW